MNQNIEDKGTRAAVLQLGQMVSAGVPGLIADAREQRDRERMEAERRGAALRFEAEKGAR